MRLETMWVEIRRTDSTVSGTLLFRFSSRRSRLRLDCFLDRLSIIGVVELDRLLVTKWTETDYPRDSDVFVGVSRNA